MPDAELVARADGLASLEVDLEHLLALYVAPGLVLQAGHELPGLDLDHVAGRRIGVAAVDAEGDPARLVAGLQALERPGGHHRGIVQVEPLVEGVDAPDLLLIRGHPEAMARAALPLD